MNPHTSTRTAIALILSFAVTRCGDDRPPPAPLAEHCGAHEPVRLLALNPDSAWLRSTKVGDRLYHSVVPTDPDGHAIFTGTSRQLWSTGLCGESPRHVIDGLDLLHDIQGNIVTTHWPEHLLACQRGTGIVVVDPTGSAPPRLVFPGDNCLGTWTDHGFLDTVQAPDDPTFAYRLYPYPDDPRSGPGDPIMLAEGLPNRQFTVLRDNALTFIASDNSLQRVDLADLDTTVIQTGVHDFVFSPDGRYLLWQEIGPNGGDPNKLAGNLILRDNQTGLDIGLGGFASTALLTTRTWWPNEAHLLLYPEDRQQLYHLPDLSIIEMPPGAQLARVLDDDRLLVRQRSPADWLGIVNPADGSFTPLFARQGWLAGIDDDAVIVLDVPLSPDHFTMEGKVWSVPLDGTTPHVLADRATSDISRVDDTRLLTRVDVDADPFAASTLLLVDTDTRHESRIDDHVTSTSIVDLADSMLLTYSVRDGERTGIWQARLPANE